MRTYAKGFEFKQLGIKLERQIYRWIGAASAVIRIAVLVCRGGERAQTKDEAP